MPLSAAKIRRSKRQNEKSFVVYYTTKEIALRLGLTSDNVKYRIRILRKTGRVEHQGSTKAGKWVILKH